MPPTDIQGLPPRPADSHKSDYGKILLIGGSTGMAGSISLSAMAALRSGAGLLKVAVPASIANVVAGFNPCYMTVPLADRDGVVAEAAAGLVSQHLRWANVVGIGPGLGQSKFLQQLVVRMYRDFERPMIVDADAINGLAVSKHDLSDHAGPRILTPHAGEFARMVEREGLAREEAESAAKELAALAGVTLVLKGNRTLVTDGHRHYHNTTGNPGMATEGCGDVLTGMIAALTGQTVHSLSPIDATILGVHLHGLAGDHAAQRLGETSLTAADIVEALPAAFAQSQG